MKGFLTVVYQEAWGKIKNIMISTWIHKLRPIIIRQWHGRLADTIKTIPFRWPSSWEKWSIKTFHNAALITNRKDMSKNAYLMHQNSTIDLALTCNLYPELLVLFVLFCIILCLLLRTLRMSNERKTVLDANPASQPGKTADPALMQLKNF